MKHKYKVSPKAERTKDGIVFDSKKEMNRYCVLKILERAGDIQNLQLQVKFKLSPAVWFDSVRQIFCFTKENKNCVSIERQKHYVADFVYFKNGRQVIEDSKGFKTTAYKKKKRLMKKLYGIEILET